MTATTTSRRSSNKVRLIDYLTRQGRQTSMDWEEYLITLVEKVCEADGERDRKTERADIRISYSPRIDGDERRQINATLSEHGYDQRTRELTIGTIYRLAKQAARRPKHRVCHLGRISTGLPAQIRAHKPVDLT